MDGPQEKKTTITENMHALSLRDLIIIKNFLEKGRRAGLFTATESPSATLVHTKLSNLIADVNQREAEKS